MSLAKAVVTGIVYKTPKTGYTQNNVAVSSFVLNNLTEEKVKVKLPGGAVYIDWSGTQEFAKRHIFMTGPAEYSFVADYML